MALYKMNIRALPPHTDHFREADILFTASNDDRSKEMAGSLRRHFTSRKCTISVHRVGEGTTSNGTT